MAYCGTVGMQKTNDAANSHNCMSLIKVVCSFKCDFIGEATGDLLFDIYKVLTLGSF